MTKRCIAPYEIQTGDLTAHIDGGASPRVAKHIASCPACAAEVAALRQMDLLFRRAFDPADTPVVIERSLHPVKPLHASAHLHPPAPKPERGIDFQPDTGRLKWLRAARVQRLALASISVLIVLSLLGLAYFVISSSGFVPPPELVQSEPVAAVAIQVDEAAEANPTDVVAVEVSDIPTTDAAQSTGIIVEKDAAIAPPRSLLLSLKQEYYGLVEPASAIAPPRYLIVMFEKEFQNRADELIAYSRTKTEPYWTESTIIDPDSGAGHLAWVERSQGYARLYVAHSMDPGETISQRVLIAQSVTDIFNPILAIDFQETLYIVWRSGRHTNAGVFFARSIDEGQTWSPAIRINDQSRRAFNPSLSVDPQGQLYVAWQGWRDANTDIYMTYSPDGGQTWNKRIRMAN